MDIQKRKIIFIQEFLKIQSEDVIAMLENVLKKESKTSEEKDFEPMTIEELNNRIDKSIVDSENGRIIEASELKAKIEKWS